MSDGLKMPKTGKYIIPKKELEELYLNKKLMLKDIARKYYVTQPLVSYLITRYGIPRRERRRYRPNFNPSPALSYIIGAVLGDGHIAKKLSEHNLVQLSVTDKDFAETFSKNLAIVVGREKPYKVSRYKHIHNNTTYYRVNCSSLELHHFFSRDKAELLEIASQHPTDFIRGFFDAEGGNSFFRGSRRFVVFAANTDRQLLEFIQKLLKNKFGIPAKLKKTHKKGDETFIDGRKIVEKQDSHQLLISGQKNVEKYYEQIGFSIKRKQLVKSVLHIDIDYRIDRCGWLKYYEKAIKEVLTVFKFKLNEIIIKPSPSNGGLHLWIHIYGRPLNEEEQNLLQALCYDDPTRVRINMMRIKRGIKRYWNKLFTRHIWTKPLPKICRKCKLRKTIMEMEKVGLEADNPHDSA